VEQGLIEKIKRQHQRGERLGKSERGEASTGGVEAAASARSRVAKKKKTSWGVVPTVEKVKHERRPVAGKWSKGERTAATKDATFASGGPKEKNV